MNLYCNKCFAKSEYKFSKPKFCPQCGERVSDLIASSDHVNSNKVKPDTKIPAIEKQRPVHLSQNDEDDDYYDDYDETQRHIDNFKRFKNKSSKFGITIEKDDLNKGVSFGQLIENSNGNSSAREEFKMTEDNIHTNKKTKQQILEEIRLEASSKPRVIDIE